MDRDPEGAKFWLRVMNELRNRGIGDILIAVVDGLKGFPEAINAVFPDTMVQTCIVHLIRHSMEFASWKDRKAIAGELRILYRAKDAAKPFGSPDPATRAIHYISASVLLSRLPCENPLLRRQPAPATSPESACASSPPRSPPSPTPSPRSRPIARATRRRSTTRRGSIRIVAAPHHGAALRRAPARQAGRVRADRGLVLLGRAVGPDEAGRLRGDARRDPGASFPPRCRSTACCSACTGRWWRYGYDDREGDLIERVRAIVGREGADRGRARPALPPDREAGAAVRHHDPLQGVPAHRFRRARRGARDADPAHHPRRDQAGDVALRLPA